MRVLVLIALLATWLCGGISSPASAQELPSPTLEWEFYQPGHPWRLWATTLGNHGTQVFCHTKDDEQAWFLLSRHDAHPPGYVWFNDVDAEFGQAAASAAEADVHVSMSYDQFSGNERTVRLRKFSSQGLDWTYTFTGLTTGILHAAVSDDGQTIAVVWSNSVAQQIEVVLFGPDAPVPLATWRLGDLGACLDFDMTPDGRLAATTINPVTSVIDLATGATLFSYHHGVYIGGNSAVKLSRDGRMLGFGSFNGTLQLWEWDGAQYGNLYSASTTGGSAVSAIGFSDDGDTVAWGHGSHFIGSPGTTARIACMDVPSLTLTMEETLESFGLWVNFPTGIHVAADGSWFVVSLAGDQPQLWDEVRFYTPDQDEPFFTFPTNGSAVSLSMSPDEAWLVVSTNLMHMYEITENGAIQAWRLRDPGVDLHPAPVLGQSIDIEVRGEPGDAAYLAAAAAPQDPPLAIPGMGVLYVDLASLNLFYVGAVSPDGSATLHALLPPESGYVGIDIHLQGFTTPPDTLTRDRLLLTLLP